jgi:cellulase (glycosyl hydrolase family 5)
VRRTLPVTAALLALAVAAAAFAAVRHEGGGRGKPAFHVEGNRILDPQDREFTVKGVVSPYGTFAGGDAGGLGRRNEHKAAVDFRRMRRLGANTVKVYATPGRTDPRRLRRVVRAARRQHLVVIVTGFWGGFRQTLPWVRRVARAYRHDPYVWLLPMNEPNCTGGNTNACTDWGRWQREHRAYIKAIRHAGMDSPIVVNTPGWSWNVAGIERHPLGDHNLVLGAHRYANDVRKLTRGQVREIGRSFAGLARERPVLLDEIGNWNGPGFANSPSWTRDMVAFARRWVESGQGSGAVAFNWRWSDPNSMTRADGSLTPWGKTFVDGYLRRVGG